LNPHKGDAAKPLLNADNEPAFREGWHAQVLAVANGLITEGHITADQWTQTFATKLRQPNTDASDELEAYYRAALSALESLLHADAAVPHHDLDERTELWRRAYLNTPHGQPVEMKAGVGDVIHQHDHGHDHHH